MAVRNCAEIGENLQKIMTRLLANDDLVKLLYYTDSNPLARPALTDAEKQALIFNKLIRIVPKVSDIKEEHCVLSITVKSGIRLAENDQFGAITLEIAAFVPFNQWMIYNSNLRPFAILGEIQKSLNGKTVNGLGKLDGGDFVHTGSTAEIAAYTTTYEIVTYD